MNPLICVRNSCNDVVTSSSYVKININKIDQFATELVSSSGSSSNNNNVEWDSSGWHYNQDALTDGPLTCQYIFVMDSLNFCFWPANGLEYDTLAVSLKNVLESNSNAFDAVNLMSIDENILQSWFPTHTIPLLSERVLRLRELGYSLYEYFDGLAVNVVKKCNNSAVKLVTLILQYFQGYRDTSVYKGKLVHFYKRAQILVGDVWAAYGKKINVSSSTAISSTSTAASTTSIFSFHDLKELTMFADYRVPQILRHMNILEYSQSLSDRIDKYIEIPFGSEEEIEIRACTVIAVEQIQQMLVSRYNVNYLSLEIDWLLWQKGEAIKDDILPHHRTLTIYY